ncbi:MAG TPA: hypothetical protein VL326_33840, partial [Kofleriaceae bacterium]|nr:hypothetical protein [Kofleriaceae bacterium]
MTVSILQTLATLPDGSLAPKLSLEELSAYLKSTYGSKAEADRMRRHCLRDEFYCDGGVDYMECVIDCVVTDQKVRDLRKPWVKHTRFNNALKRIINELSTVYTQPAKRSVDGDDANQQAYRDLLAAVRWDELALQMSRLLNLHRQLLIGFRVTQMPDGTRAPTVDIATPASVVAVTHPNDSKMVIGWIIKTDHKKVRPLVDVPTYVLWTDHERIYLDGEFKVMADRFSQQYMYLEHGLGVCPWMPVSLAPPRPGFWSGEEGEDLVSAHVCIWLANIFMMKETKSASKVPVFSGDTSTMAREQAIDTEGALDVPEGVGVSVIDMSMDLSMFRDGADHILASAGNNYGMPPNLIKNEGVQSAEARDLMRVPLRELRL